MATEYDLIVIGTGNAGQAAIGPALDAGWRVAIVDEREPGGTCALRGCVPKKVLVAAAEMLHLIARARELNVEVGRPRLDWPALIARKQTFIDGVPDEVAASLRRRGVDLLAGACRFVGPRALAIGDRTITAKKIVVATGSRPRPLSFPGADRTIDSEVLLSTAKLPESIVFVGGGVVAMELAHVLAHAGARVTILERLARPLSNFACDAVERVLSATRELGIDIVTEASVERIEPEDGGSRVHYRHQGRSHAVAAELVQNGAGRIPAVDDLGLDAAEIARDGTSVDVDAYLRSTTQPDVLFAGDALAHRPQLSPLASHEGGIAGHNAVHPGHLRTPDYESVPACVFTIPTLATVGLDEAEADERGLTYEVERNDMESWRSARTYAEEIAFTKVLIGADGQILGAHLVGHGAAEVIHTFAFAMRHGITAQQLRDTVYAYPTFTSDVKYMI